MIEILKYSIDNFQFSILSVNKHSLAILTLIWFLFIVLPIGNRGLWAPDEPRYLQVAWEMSRAESYLLPLMNGEIYAEKPPLFFWLTILLARLTSFETASRWVSALASLGVILLTYSLGRILSNRETGFTAALILMTLSLFALLMHTGNIDTTLTFFTTLSLFCFIKWEQKAKLMYLVLAYGACGVGILAKGPVALLIPWLAYTVWEIVKRFCHQKSSYTHLLWGPLVALAVTSLWLIPACIAGGKEYTQIILFKQQVGRAVQAYVHRGPWYKYLLVLPLNALPWFVLIPAAVPPLTKRLKAKDRSVLLFALWFLTTLVFFSLVSSKREPYLLPCYPVFALLLANAAAGWTGRRHVSVSLNITAVITLAGALALLLFPLILPFLKGLYPVLTIFPVSAGNLRLLALFALGIGTIAVIRQAFKRVQTKHHLAACNAIALAFLIIGAMGQIYYIPYIDPVKSAQHASETIQALLPPEGTLAFYRRRFDNGWNFYLNRAKIPIITDAQIRQKQPRYDVIILRKKHLDSLKAVLDMDRYRIAAIEPVGSKKIVLLAYNLIKGKAPAVRPCHN